MFVQDMALGGLYLEKYEKKGLHTPNYCSTKLIVVITDATWLHSNTREPVDKDKLFHNPLIK